MSITIITFGTVEVYGYSYTTEAQARRIFEAAHAHGATKTPAEASAWLLREADDPNCWMVIVADEASVLTDFAWEDGKPYPLDEPQARTFLERRDKALSGKVGGTRTKEASGAVAIRDTLPANTIVRITDGEWTEEKKA